MSFCSLQGWINPSPLSFAILMIPFDVAHSLVSPLNLFCDLSLTSSTKEFHLGFCTRQTVRELSPIDSQFASGLEGRRFSWALAFD